MTFVCPTHGALTETRPRHYECGECGMTLDVVPIPAPKASTPRFHRVAAGDYETADGRFRLYRLVDVNPPAWNVEDVTRYAPDSGTLVVDGAASKRDALGLFAEWWAERPYSERKRAALAEVGGATREAQHMAARGGAR